MARIYESGAKVVPSEPAVRSCLRSVQSYRGMRKRPLTFLQSRVRQLSPREERERGDLSSCSVRSGSKEPVWMRAGANSHGRVQVSTF